MLNVTRLLGELDGPGPEPPAVRPGGPPAVVVWNVTRRCNLGCIHCYASAARRPDPVELTTVEGRLLIDELARAGVGALILSGGEPLLRPDLPRLAAVATEAGLHTAISTNGVLLDRPAARALARAGVAYVGVSIDGLGATHDRMRGRRGAWEAALAGLRTARDAGLRVGLRFTLARSTLPELPDVLDLMEAERVDRGYISHLVYVGRARRLSREALAPEEARAAVERLFDRAEAWRRRGVASELVTGNNDADGAALYLRLRKRCAQAAARVRRRLAARGGNASGVAIGSVDFRGDVHPDQFWPHARLGNVREQPFEAIWRDPAQPLLAALRDRRRWLTGRCRDCAHLDLCGGGNRVRAEALTGDLWASDPGCHLTDTERGTEHWRTRDATLDPDPGGDAPDLAPRECAPAGA